MTDIKLTQYSHGAGCGCKISPEVLDEILKTNIAAPDNLKLLVGNHSRDDAAVYDLGNGNALISTTDFFMPIVDDPFEFGRIAAANAISDVYAMGGSPILAIAILGWPVNKLSASVAQNVIAGGRSICAEAGIPLAGGHSIDSPEPIFGLAVNGIVPVNNIKQNNLASAGDYLFLTKPLGVGILTTAEKMGLLEKQHESIAARQMMQLNKAGEAFGKMEAVTALTDVTGFGLLGHVVEMAEGGNVSVEIYPDQIPLIIPELKKYISLKAVPGGTSRNWKSYGHKIGGSPEPIQDHEIAILADPQTSGGLLVAVRPSGVDELRKVLSAFGLADYARPIGRIVEKNPMAVRISPFFN